MTCLPAGTCKWFDVTKGYGFIKPDDGSQDLFVHQVTAQRVVHDAPLLALQFLHGLCCLRHDGREAANIFCAASCIALPVTSGQPSHTS